MHSPETIPYFINNGEILVNVVTRREIARSSKFAARLSDGN